MGKQLLAFWWVLVPLLLTGAYYVRLRVQVSYTYSSELHRGVIVLSVFRIPFSVRRRVTLREGKRTGSLREELQGVLHSFLEPAGVIAVLLPRPVRIDTLCLEVHLGTGNAALTGITVGAAYAIIYPLLAPLNGHAVYTHPPRVRVTPDFSRALLSASADCIVTPRLGDIMSVVLRILARRIAKGVASKWKSIPSRV